MLQEYVNHNSLQHKKKSSRPIKHYEKAYHNLVFFTKLVSLVY